MAHKLVRSIIIEVDGMIVKVRRKKMPAADSANQLWSPPREDETRLAVGDRRVEKLLECVECLVVCFGWLQNWQNTCGLDWLNRLHRDWEIFWVKEPLIVRINLVGATSLLCRIPALIWVIVCIWLIASRSSSMVGSNYSSIFFVDSTCSRVVLFKINKLVMELLQGNWIFACSNSSWKRHE